MELILLERRSELCFIIGQGIKNFGGCLRIQLSSHVLHTATQPRGVTVKLKVTPLAPGTGLNRHIASTVLVWTQVLQYSTNAVAPWVYCVQLFYEWVLTWRGSRLGESSLSCWGRLQLAASDIAAPAWIWWHSDNTGPGEWGITYTGHHAADTQIKSQVTRGEDEWLKANMIKRNKVETSLSVNLLSVWKELHFL